MTHVPERRFTAERTHGMTVHRGEGVSLTAVLAALDAEGEVLKATRKSTTRHVGDWVVKTSGYEAGLGVFKRTLLRARYRRGWVAAQYLPTCGINVARPYAFVEVGRWGFITKNALICEYLDDACDVEAYADRLVAQHASGEEIHAYLARIADAVNTLIESGAYHADLAGKNILTRDGQSFFFVDLDSVVLTRSYTQRRRLKNHVQLYDSFCDRWDDRFLESFLARMLPNADSLPKWMARVRKRQSARRARTEAAWRRQGRL